MDRDTAIENAATASSAPRLVRVVIVDDSNDIRRLIRRGLANDPTIEVVAEAANGDLAVSVVAVTQPDVVIMDVRMPGSDGIGATAAITEAYPDIEVIGFSSDASGRPEMEAAGATHFVFKGQSIDELKKAIHTTAAIRRSRSHHEAPPNVLEAIARQQGDERSVRREAAETGRSMWTSEVPFDLAFELERYPRAKQRFDSMPEDKQCELVAHVNAADDSRREMRIANVVMSLDY